jgi:DNA gyrase subunit A
MATNMPPHNLTEIADAVALYIDNPECTIDDMMKHIKGPDFPTGGIIFGRKGIRQAYKTGRGKIIVRGRFTLEVDKKGKETIIFSEIPYTVNKATLITRIAELVRDKVIDGISEVRDESDRDGMRIVIELKRGAIAKVVLNQLFSIRRSSRPSGVINLALVKGRRKRSRSSSSSSTSSSTALRSLPGVPSSISRKPRNEPTSCADWSSPSRTSTRLSRSSKNRGASTRRKSRLWNGSDFPIPSQAIVDMRLGKLTSLETEKILQELAEIEALIAHLKDLLANPPKILALIKTEIGELANKLATSAVPISSPTRSRNQYRGSIQKEEMVILISNVGYIKRVPASAYKSQNRGGKGSNSAKLTEDDFVNQVFTASTHDHVVFLTSMGKAYWVKVHEIPEATRTSRGAHIKSLLTVSSDEEINYGSCTQRFQRYRISAHGNCGGRCQESNHERFPEREDSRYHRDQA